MQLKRKHIDFKGTGVVVIVENVVNPNFPWVSFRATERRARTWAENVKRLYPLATGKIVILDINTMRTEEVEI